MATLRAQDRDRLRTSQFAYVDRQGGEHLPINDEAHIRNAIARWNQTEFQIRTAKEKARQRIVGAARRYGIEVDKGSNVAKPTRSRKRS
jgi:hypothetical protein